MAVTKDDFAPILNQVIIETLNSSILKNSFKASGLFPWNTNQINFKKCLGQNQVTEKSSLKTDSSFQKLNLNIFCNEVGAEMIFKFDNLNTNSETVVMSEEFLALSRIYNLLKKSSSKNINKNVTKENQDMQTEIEPDVNISSLEIYQSNNILDHQTENYDSFSDIT